RLGIIMIHEEGKPAADYHGVLRLDFFLFKRPPDRLPHETLAFASAVRGHEVSVRGGAGRRTKRCQLAAKFLEISKIADLEQTVPGLIPGSITGHLCQFLIEAALDDQPLCLLLNDR